MTMKTTSTPEASGSSTCSSCCFWRDRLFNKRDCTGDLKPSGLGECMLNPPTLMFKQGAANKRQTWAGPVTSVIHPGVEQARPTVSPDDFCQFHQTNAGEM